MQCIIYIGTCPTHCILIGWRVKSSSVIGPQPAYIVPSAGNHRVAAPYWSVPFHVTNWSIWLVLLFLAVTSCSQRARSVLLRCLRSVHSTHVYYTLQCPARTVLFTQVLFLPAHYSSFILVTNWLCKTVLSYKVTRLQGHQVTRSPGYKVTRSPGYKVTRSPGHQTWFMDTRLFCPTSMKAADRQKICEGIWC